MFGYRYLDIEVERRYLDIDGGQRIDLEVIVLWNRRSSNEVRCYMDELLAAFIRRPKKF